MLNEVNYRPLEYRVQGISIIMVEKNGTYIVENREKSVQSRL